MTLPKVGDKIKFTRTNDPYTDLILNDYVGIVEEIIKVNFPNDPFTQIWVKWDNGHCFAIVPESGDQYEIQT